MAGAKEKLRTLVAEERQEGKQGKESTKKIGEAASSALVAARERKEEGARKIWVD